MPYYAVFVLLLLNLDKSTVPNNFINQVILNLRRNDFIVSLFLLARQEFEDII